MASCVMPKKIRQLIADVEGAGFGRVPWGQTLGPEVSPPAPFRRGGKQMKVEDSYLKFVRWSEPDSLYVGYCPDLFPWGGVCHAATEEETYRELRSLVREELDELQRD